MVAAAVMVAVARAAVARVAVSKEAAGLPCRVTVIRSASARSCGDSES